MANNVRLILTRPWMGHWIGDSVEVSEVEAKLLIESGTAAEGPGVRAAGADARVEADGAAPGEEPVSDPGQGTGAPISEVGPKPDTEADKQDEQEGEKDEKLKPEAKAIDGPPENKARKRSESK